VNSPNLTKNILTYILTYAGQQRHGATEFKLTGLDARQLEAQSLTPQALFRLSGADI
jgi:hypothetical protein